MIPEDNDQWGALISLLDDPDFEAYHEISEKIFAKGSEAIAPLEEAWMHATDGLMQKRIEEIIHQIQFNDTQVSLAEWFATGASDLFSGFFLVTRFQYPEIREDKLRELFSRITRDVWLEINNNLTPLEKIKVINHVFFKVHQFSGETSNLQSTESYYLNNLLESRTGNPLSLGMIYLCVTQVLGLPVFGVDLPRNFVLVYTNLLISSEVAGMDMVDEIFFINPFSKGTVFTRKEVMNYLTQLKIEPEQRYFIPCSNKTIIIRMLNELIYLYQKNGDGDKSAELRQVLETISPD